MNINFPNNVLYPLPTKQLSEITHRVGNVYFVEDYGGQYNYSVYCVLAQVGFSQIALMCLTNNTNRWCSPIAVRHIQKISQKEFDKICDNRDGEKPQIQATYVGRLEALIFGEEEVDE